MRQNDDNLLLGIDGGTGGIRAGIYDPEGRCLSFSAVEYPTAYLSPGFVEQKPEDWWNTLIKAIRLALSQKDIDASRIRAMACDTTSTSVVFCRKDGTPVRDSIIWMDVRAKQEADELLRKTGEFYSPEWMPPKIAWVKRNEKENYDKTEVICEYQDYLTFRLTGQWCMNNNTACNWAYNINTGFASEIYEALDIVDALTKFPQEHVYRVADIIGPVSREAALMTGLKEDTLLIQGGIDSSISLLGMGVNKEGIIGMITGSSNLAMALNRKPLLNPDGSNNGPDNLIRGYYTDYVAQSASGSILSWYKKEFLSGMSYKEIDDIAKDIPIGSNGLILLDHFQGIKHPYFDSRVRGMFYGLSLSHTRYDLYRSILEGVAYGTELILDVFRDKGVKIREMNIAGGSSRSPLWMQIHADVSNIIINVPEDINAPCLGCAIVCAAALGLYQNIEEAVKQMVRFDRTYIPDQESHQQYKKIYELYKQLYPLNKEWMHAFSDTFDR